MSDRKIGKALRLVAGICALMPLFLTSAPAHAQKIKELFDKEMPKYEVIPDEKFREQTFLQTDIPYGDKALAYKIRLPKEWKAPLDKNSSNYNLSNYLLGEVAAFYSPPRLESRRSKFEILALKLDYEITAEQWFLQYILSNGYTLEGLKYYNKDKVGALHVFLNDGETYVARSIAQINGKRMILANYIIPAAEWGKEAAITGQSMDTFELMNPDDSMIETMNEHMFLDIAKFQYPASWKIQTSPIRTIERIGAKINNFHEGETNILDGQIEINLASTYVVTNLEEEHNNLKVELRRRGILINDLVETIEDFDFGGSIDFGFIDVYQANDTNNKSMQYEVWIGTLAVQSYYGFITLLTPARDSEFFTWSRNVSAFEAILRTIEIQGGKKTAEDEMRAQRKNEGQAAAPSTPDASATPKPETGVPPKPETAIPPKVESGVPPKPEAGAL